MGCLLSSTRIRVSSRNSTGNSSSSYPQNQNGTRNNHHHTNRGDNDPSSSSITAVNVRGDQDPDPDSTPLSSPTLPRPSTNSSSSIPPPPTTTTTTTTTTATTYSTLRPLPNTRTKLPSTTTTPTNPPTSKPKSKPLTRHRTWSNGTSPSGHPWTRRTLDHERRAFFDTRVTGREEVWQSIHAALTFLWDPALIPQPQQQREGSSEVSPDSKLDLGLINARAILEAAEVVLPKGGLAGEAGVYDRLGGWYVLPEWVVCDPCDLIIDNDEGEEEGEVDERRRSRRRRRRSRDQDKDSDTDESESTKLHHAHRRREEKGKGIARPENHCVRVRVRLSDDRPDGVVSIARDQSIWLLKRTVLEEFNIPNDSINLKLFYLGHRLKESSSFDKEAVNWKEGFVVNAFLCNR